MAQKINKKENRKLNTVIVFIVWWLIWGSLHAWVLQYFGIAYKRAVADAAVSCILLAAFCLFVINNMRYYLPKKEKYLYVLFMSFALSALWLAATNISLKRIFTNEVVYLQLLHKSLVIRYAAGFLIIDHKTFTVLF